MALVVDPSGQGTADQVQEGVRRAGTALAEAGYALDEIKPPSIAQAATALVMLSTPGIRKGWEEFMSPIAPVDLPLLYTPGKAQHVPTPNGRVAPARTRAGMRPV